MVLAAGKLLESMTRTPAAQTFREWIHRLHSERVVKIRRDGRAAYRVAVVFQWSENGSREDIATRFWQGAQLRFRNIEVLGEHLRSRVGKPTSE